AADESAYFGAGWPADSARSHCQYQARRRAAFTQPLSATQLDQDLGSAVALGRRRAGCVGDDGREAAAERSPYRLHGTVAAAAHGEQQVLARARAVDHFDFPGAGRAIQFVSRSAGGAGRLRTARHVRRPDFRILEIYGAARFELWADSRLDHDAQHLFTGRP